MIENPSYHHLLRLFADDNDIESLLELEGTDFIQNFDSFHLRRNKLKTVSKIDLTKKKNALIQEYQFYYVL